MSPLQSPLLPWGSPASRTTRHAAAWGLVLAAAVTLTACSSAGTPAAPVKPAPTPTFATPPPSAAAPPTTSQAPAVRPADPVDARFKSRAEKACAPWLVYGIDHQYPFAETNAQALTPAQLPTVGAYWNSLPLNQQLLTTMTALGEPTNGTAAWAVVLEDFARYDKSIKAAVAAAQSATAQAWQPALDALNADKDTTRSDLLTSGFGVNDNCPQLFEGSSYH